MPRIGDRVVITRGLWVDEHGIVVQDPRTKGDYIVVEIDRCDGYRVVLRNGSTTPETAEHGTEEAYTVKLRLASGTVTYADVWASSVSNALDVAQHKFPDMRPMEAVTVASTRA